jgi:hypothetical protein
MASGPRIFAAFVRSSLDTLDRRDAALGARVRARLSPETARALGDASAVSYVPVALDVEVTECLFAEAGAERACAVLRDNLELTFESPLLSSLVSGALRLLGRAPGRVLGWSTKFWAQLYRDAGRLAYVADGGNAGRLELRDLPACVVESRNYLLGMAAALDAVFVLLDVEGDARLGAVDVAARSADIRLAWKPR